MFEAGKRTPARSGRSILLERAIVAGALSLLAPMAFAQTDGVPAYISALDDFEVARLDGGLAPANGNVTMRDVTPAEWQSSDPGNSGLEGVITAWNGGAKATGASLYVHGGGHTDSANNGLYVYDFSGDASPQGWLSPLKISSLSAVTESRDTYSDGLPTAVHTYDGLVFASHNQHIYRFGGSQYRNGFMTNASFKYDVRAREWTQVPDYPDQAGGAKTLYDPESGKIFVTMNDTLGGYFYRTDTDSWSGPKSYGGNGFPFNSMGAFDPTRNRGIIVGDDEMSLLGIDFENETVNLTSFDPSGSTGIFSGSGISAVYDPRLDVYWIFGGGSGSSGWSNIYQMNADGPPWTVTSFPLTGAAISRTSGMVGSWGRFVLMTNWRAIGVVADVDSAAFVIKLPGEAVSVKTPLPPTDLHGSQ
jgi:hypothetical protein